MTPVSDLCKNWDTLAALDCILDSTSTSAKILDAGAETYSRILPWLFLYGYRNLEGINIGFKGNKKRGPIIYRYGDVTHTARKCLAFPYAFSRVAKSNRLSKQPSDADLLSHRL
jgi:hypothetical protein